MNLLTLSEADILSRLKHQVKLYKENPDDTSCLIFSINLLILLMGKLSQKMCNIIDNIHLPGNASSTCFDSKMKDANKFICANITTMTHFWVTMMACYSGTSPVLYPIIPRGMYYMIALWADTFYEKFTTTRYWILNDEYFVTEVEGKIADDTFMDFIMDAMVVIKEVYHVPDYLLASSNMDIILEGQEKTLTEKARKLSLDMNQIEEYVHAANMANNVLLEYHLCKSQEENDARIAEADQHLREMKLMREDYGSRCSYLNTLRLFLRGDISMDALLYENYQAERQRQEVSESTKVEA